MLSKAYFLPSCSVGSLDSLRDLGYNQVTMIIRRYPFILPGGERRWESDVFQRRTQHNEPARPRTQSVVRYLLGCCGSHQKGVDIHRSRIAFVKLSLSLSYLTILVLYFKLFYIFKRINQYMITRGPDL